MDTESESTTTDMASPAGDATLAGSSRDVRRGIGDSTTRVVGRWLRSERAMFALLAVASLSWTVTLGWLTVLRQDRFGTFDFDTGIYDQLIWGAAHGHWFTTVRGVPFLGHHASFGFLLLAPLVWMGAGPNTWSLLNACALASCAPILYLIARDRFHRPWIGAAVGLVWLAQPSVQWWVWEGFHPECVALPFLFATWLHGQRIATRLARGVSIDRRTKWSFAASFLGTIIWKEDLALALVGMGLVWAVRRHWRLALPVIAVAALWFVVFGAWMVPHFAGGTVYSGIYGDLGATPGQMVAHSIRDPSMLLDRWSQNDAVAYSSRLHQSFGYVSLLSPVTWMIGAPQWFADISSAASFTWDPHFRYQAIPTAALMISFIEAVWFLLRRRRWLGEVAVIVGLCAAMWCGWAHGAGPWSPSNFRSGYWPLSVDADHSARQEALALIGPVDGVSADYLMVPHLTHRTIVYTFPNPWSNSNYGTKPTDHGDPAKVRWIVVDTNLLSKDSAALYASIESSGEFRLVMARGPIQVLERIRPPGKGRAAIVTG